MQDKRLYRGLIATLILCLVRCCGCNKPSQAIPPKINRTTQAQVFLITNPQHPPTQAYISERHLIDIVPTLPNPIKRNPSISEGVLSSFVPLYLVIAVPVCIYCLTYITRPVVKIKAQLETMQTQIVKMQKQMETIQTQMVKMQIQTVKMQTQMEMMQTQIVKIQTQTLKMQTQIVKMQTQIVKIQTQMEATQTQMKSVQEDINNLKSIPKANSEAIHTHLAKGISGNDDDY